MRRAAEVKRAKDDGSRAKEQKALDLRFTAASGSLQSILLDGAPVMNFVAQIGLMSTKDTRG